MHGVWWVDDGTENLQLQAVIFNHALLSLWGRGAYVFLTDIDELLVAVQPTSFQTLLSGCFQWADHVTLPEYDTLCSACIGDDGQVGACASGACMRCGNKSCPPGGAASMGGQDGLAATDAVQPAQSQAAGNQSAGAAWVGVSVFCARR